MCIFLGQDALNDIYLGVFDNKTQTHILSVYLSDEYATLRIKEKFIYDLDQNETVLRYIEPYIQSVGNALIVLDFCAKYKLDDVRHRISEKWIKYDRLVHEHLI